MTKGRPQALGVHAGEHMSNIVTVDFRNDTLFAVERDDGVFVAVKPIADRLGLKWSGQHDRLNRSQILREGIRVMRMPSVGGEQETTVLRLDLLNGWLFGIDAERVKPEVRELVLAYQRDCYQVLHDHFHGRRSTVPLEGSEPATNEPAALKHVTEARLSFGHRAAQQLWFKLGLPTVPAMFEADRQVALFEGQVGDQPAPPRADEPSLSLESAA